MDPAMREVLIRHSRPARNRFGEPVPERRAEQLPEWVVIAGPGPFAVSS
jgi:hypothetical protein